MGLHEKFHRITTDHNQQVFEDNAKEAGRKRINTTFMGAIATVEEQLGKLWGHPKPFEELTENEKKFWKIWRRMRNEILDKGNHQLRLFLKDLERKIK